MPKYWGGGIISHMGISPKWVKCKKRRRKKKRERERAKVGDNNGQATHAQIVMPFFSMI